MGSLGGYENFVLRTRSLPVKAMLVDENRHIQGKLISRIDFNQRKLAFICVTTRVPFALPRKILKPPIVRYLAD